MLLRFEHVPLECCGHAAACINHPLRINFPGSVSARLLSSLVFGLVLLSSSVCAQPSSPSSPASSPPDSTTSPSSLQKGAQSLNGARISVWFGGSLQPSRLIGKIAKSKFALLGLRYHRRLLPQGSDRPPPQSTTLTYTADLFPAALLSIPPHTIPASHATPTQGEVWQSGFQTYGFGASPMGLRLNYRPTKRVQPFITGSVGFIYFFLPMPDQRGKHLNFTADAGLGVQVVLTSSTTLTLGYRYHHLSNGFRGKINPGVDANLLYLGVTLLP